MVASVGISASFLKKNKRKVEFLEDLCAFHTKIVTANLYHQSILSVMGGFQGHEDFKKMIISIENQIENGELVLVKQDYVTESQLSELNEYFTGICALERVNRDDFMKYYANSFNEWKKQEQDAYEKCKKTYLKLGFLFGLMLLIIVI